MCRECSAKLSKRYYAGHKLEHRKVVAARRSEKRKHLMEKTNAIKQLNPCPCGESDPACLDFHHIGTKVFDISYLISNREWAWQKVLNEMAKCVILCANCHRKLHSGRTVETRPIKL